MALTEAQHAERATGIGGSDVAAILGLSPWKTPHQVWLEKLGQLQLPGVSTGSEEAMNWGTLLEPVIRDEWSRRAGIKVVQAVHSFAHPNPELAFMRANVDGIVPPDEGLEIKCVSEYSQKEWGEQGSDEIPTYYLTQVMHYMAVMGWKGCHIAALFGGNKLRSYYVPRSESLIKEIIEREVQFWNDHVLAKVAPPMTSDEMVANWTKTTGKEIEATPEVAAAVEKLKKLKAEIKEASDQLDPEEKAVKQFIKDNDILTVGGKKVVSWKYNVPSNRFSSSALEKEDPETYKQYIREVPGPRVFRTY